MSELFEFLVAVVVALIVGVAAMAALYAPLRRVLGILCGTDAGAAFWAGYSALFMVLLPVLGVASMTWVGGDALSPAEALSRTLSLAVAGLIMALLAIGRTLLNNIRAETPIGHAPTGRPAPAEGQSVQPTPGREP